MSEAHGAPTGANGVQNGAASAGEVQLELGSQQKVSIHSSDLVKGSTLTSTPVVFRVRKPAAAFQRSVLNASYRCVHP